MPNLKNIADLPVVESADGLNLIVEDNGSAKRIAVDKIEGKVKSVNGVMPDENGNVKVETASSWNDLTDKPFYEETVTVNEPLNITWDGNTEGLVSDSSGIYYKVSNLVLSDEQIKLTKLTMSTGDSLSISEFWDSLVEGGAVTEDYVFLEYAILIRNDRVEMMGRVFTESGIYFGTGSAYVSSLTTTEPIEQTKTVIKKIDEKYLPEVGGSNITYFYGDGDYLFWDEDLTTKVSRVEFQESYQNGEIRVICSGTKDCGFIYHPIMINNMNNYTYVRILDDNRDTVCFYTSEYVEAAPPV